MSLCRCILSAANAASFARLGMFIKCFIKTALIQKLYAFSLSTKSTSDLALMSVIIPHNSKRYERHQFYLISLGATYNKIFLA